MDEKVAYLLTKPVTFKAEDANGEKYIGLVKDILGKRFQYQLSRLGYEASNKGIAWLHIYIDPSGALRTMVIPSEQCIPIWKDKNHEELECLIRRYKMSTDQ